MFVAPLTLPSTTSAARPRKKRRGGAAAAALVAWLLAGLVAIALVPALRGGATLGATLPFWLVAAPAIDLAWLARARIAAAIARAARRLPRPATQARRLQRSRRPRRSSR